MFMLVGTLVAFLHFAAAFGIAITLSFEWLAMTESPSYEVARRIQWCDLCYGLSAIVLVVAGLLRVLYYDKGVDYYLSNPFFITKMALGTAIGMLSIYPTVRFTKWSKETKQGLSPVVTKGQFLVISRIVRTELLLLVLMALCASFMARGIGL
jgi:putative membrane protein